MLMKLRIIVLMTIGLSSNGSTLTELPRLSEEGSVSLSPQNNTEGESESRSFSIGFFNPSQEIEAVKTNVMTLQTQMANLNMDVSVLKIHVEKLMQSQPQASNLNILSESTSIMETIAEADVRSSSNLAKVEQLEQFQQRADTSIQGAETNIQLLRVNGVDMEKRMKALETVNRASASNLKDVSALNTQVAQLRQFQERTDASMQNMTTLLNALATVNQSSSCNCKDISALNKKVEQLMQFRKRAYASLQDMTMLFEDMGTVNGTSPSNRDEKCPPAASQKEGKVIGNFCYLVSAISLNFSQAQNACNVLAGNLAQPLPILAFNHRFYTALKGVFPTEFGKIKSAAVNAGSLWIGYKQETADADGGIFTGQTSAFVTVDIGSVILNEKVETVAQEGLAITDQGFWKIFPLSQRLPYLCQFPQI